MVADGGSIDIVHYLVAMCTYVCVCLSFVG